MSRLAANDIALWSSVGRSVLLTLFLVGTTSGPARGDCDDSPFYPLFDDLVSELESLAAAHDIVSVRELTTVTWSDGGDTFHKPVLAVKVSDNAEDEEDEPAFLFTGVIHGREPLGVNVCLWLIREWVENYGDPAYPEIEEWVDNNEIWFVPVLNVYGYENVNRKNHDDVDLARNYGFRWEMCTSCDYTNTADDNYPGTAAFSTQEIQVMRDLVLEERPLFGLTFHSGRSEVMRPWGLSGGVTLNPTDRDVLVDFQDEIRSLVLAAYGAGGFCDTTADIYDATICSTFPKTTLGPYGQPENWYQAYGGVLGYTIEMAPNAAEYRHCCFYDPAHCNSCSGCTDPGDCDLNLAKACEHVRVYQELIRGMLDFAVDGPGVTGTITDAITAQKLSATVGIVGQDDDQDVDADGDPDGFERTSDPLHGRYYRLLQSGTHTVEVSKVGYDPASSSVSVGATGFTTLDFELTPRLEILHPTAQHVAHAGTPSGTPRTFVVRMLLGSPGDPCVTGLDFTVELRDDNNDWVEAVVSAQACVQDHYWVPVSAPTGGTFTAGATYDLRVTIDTVTAESLASVEFSDVENDTVLVLDTSDSMDDGGKLGATQQAAELLAHELSEEDQGALVTFRGNGMEPDGDATLRQALVAMIDENREELIEKIQLLFGSGATSIGDGLLLALEEIDTRGDPDHDCVLVLLSDGNENEAELWVDMHEDIEDSPCVVHAVALGPEADEDLLEVISQSGGGGAGSFEYATITDGSAAAFDGGGGGVDDPPTWRNQLGGIFDAFATRMADRQRLLAAAGRTASLAMEKVLVDSGLEEAVFAFKWEEGDGAVVELRDPGGGVVLPGPGVVVRSGPTDVVYRVRLPAPGMWEAQIAPAQGAKLVDYALLVSGESERRLIVVVSSQLGPREKGDPIVVGALVLKGRLPVLGAEVTATVIAPDGRRSRLLLLDDGSHADGRPNDGFYANLYRGTAFHEEVIRGAPEGQGLAVRGSYGVRVVAVTSDFRREATGSFVIRDAQDRDEDGLPDRYEVRHGLDPRDPSDAGMDHDLDGMPTRIEFRYGTDPLSSDTDGGGENDASEVRNGRDPLWPEDDAIDAVEGFVLELVPGAVLVQWKPVEGLVYALWRRGPEEDWRLLSSSDLPPTGEYRDAKVAEGVLYAYCMMARHPEEPVSSGVTPPRSAVPRADPIPPSGIVVINDDDPTTTSRDVILSFAVSPDTAYLRVGLLHDVNADLGYLKWQRMAPQVAWHIPDDVRPGTRFTIYAQFRDEAGNESTIASDSIVFEGQQPRFVRGDCNGDGAVVGSATDTIFLFSYLFLGGRTPSCLAACDVNGDGVVIGSVTDGVYLLQFNFLGGPPPPKPYPSCGPPTLRDAELGCELSTAACR